MDRRHFLAALPAAGLAPALTRAQLGAAAFVPPDQTTGLLQSPPVVQHLTAAGFTVSIRVGRLATAWVEWGTDPAKLDHKAVSSRGGLVDAGATSLTVPVVFPEPQPGGAIVHYRVCVQPLAYANAYKLTRGETETTGVRALRIPDPAAASVRVAIVNDTHENKETLAKLPGRIDAAAPHLLVWNGDTCNDFDAKDDPAAILLTPGAAADHPSNGGWASSRPLWFVAGNHDVRGERAREVMDILAPGPVPGLPWNFAFRDGPLALIGLDTGEDKPDAHPVFAGTAAYEPYRERQAVWLKEALARPEIASAPFKVVVCHIPLRGGKNDNPGTTIDGYAEFSGFGAKHWFPLLREAGVRMIVSGHTHDWRIDDPSEAQPFYQVVGGGPQPARATLTVIDVTAEQLSVRIEDLAGKKLDGREIKI